MQTSTKPEWENLSEAHRKTWVDQVVKFYLPAVVSPQDAVELARDEYNDSESLLPEPESETDESI